jgi:hypothetical protein
MRVAYAVVALLITASCASIARDTPTPGPQTVATQPGAPQPAAKPAEPLTPQPQPAAAPVPRTSPPVPPAAGTPSQPVAKTPAPAPALDLKTLEAQLRDTKASASSPRLRSRIRSTICWISSASTTRARRRSR